jgi:hypothetical protein
MLEPRTWNCERSDRMSNDHLTPFGKALLRWCKRTPATEIGRDASLRVAILDTCAWLEARGWYGTDRGWLQCYALWLLTRREDYARTRGS